MVSAATEDREQRDTEILRLYGAGWPGPRITAHLNIKSWTVTNAVRKHGVARNPRGPRAITVSRIQRKHGRPPWDPVEYDNFLASAEVLAFAAFLESMRLPEIAEIIRKIGRHYGYRQTAEWFRPAFEAYRNRR